MDLQGRAARGAEAGVVAAGAVELSFLVFDLVRLQPLATPLTLSGVMPTPGGLLIDLTTLSGVLAFGWAAYQLVALTVLHLVVFGVVGVAVSYLFDWSRPGGIGRYVTVAGLCMLGFFVTVALSSSTVALGSVGAGTVILMNLGAAAVLAGGLHLVSKAGQAE